jgi:hypothetical protein
LSDITCAAGNTTVEELIRYAGNRFNAAGVAFQPPRMSRLIRGLADLGNAKQAIDNYLSDRAEAQSWAGFELYVNGGYKDPTGAHAARNVDLQRRAVVNQ